jgi:selenocysteine lyase/cysteine desulfurase
LKTLERDGAIELTLVDCDASGHVDARDIVAQIKHNTKAVVVNHCSNVTGAVTDLQTIGRATADRGIPFIVDASQSAGSLPIDLGSWPIDLLAFAGHKSLYGLQGIGGLFIRDTIRLEPLKVGGTGVRSDYLFQPEKMPMYYEAGTPNLPGIISLRAGVSFILETGPERIHQRKTACVRRMMEHLAKKKDITLYPPYANKKAPEVFSFNIRHMKPADVGYILEHSFDIIIRSGLHCAPLIHKAIHSYPQGSVRVSPSYFTTDDEIATFLKAIDTSCEAGSDI